MEYTIREVNMVGDEMTECINELDLIKTEDMFEEDYGSADMQCYSDNMSTDTADYETHTMANNCLDMNNQRCQKRKHSDDNRKVISTSRTIYQQQQQHQRFIFPHTGEAQQEDLELLTLLSEWKLQRLYKDFLAQGISLFILRIMKSHHIEKLCKDFNVGTMAYFEHCLQNWRNSNIPLTINCEPMTLANAAVPPTNCATPTDTNIASILKGSKYGAMLLRFYDEHKEFREEDRTRLISLIAQYYDQNDIHLSLPQTYKIEQAVIDMFPTEKLEFYRTSKRGRIYNKYCNLKSATRNLKINTNTEIKCPPDTEAVTLFPEKNAEVAMSHLKHSELSTLEFDHYWKECSNYRISDIRNSHTLMEVFQKWPQYQSISKAYHLIDMDFSVLYPNKKSILQKWLEVEDALCTTLDNERSIRKKSVRDALSNITKTSKNGKAATLMWATHAFLVPWQREVSKDSTGKKFFIRFTITDSQDSFLVLCANEQEIEEQIKCRDLNSAPIIMTISSDISIINEVYVVFANTKYAFDNFIEALDMCFKIFLLFNIDFPKAAVNFWNFIQNFFYEIKSKEQFGKVSILMMEITKKMLQIPCSNAN